MKPDTQSCTAPPKTHPIGMIQKHSHPNLIPMITPITGPTPAMFSSWISIFFHIGSGT